MNKERISNGPEFHLSGRSKALRIRFAACLIIFLVAFGVRFLSWHDTRLEVGKVQTGVTSDYKRVAHLLRQDGVVSFLSPTSPLSDLNNFGHPPGYPILLAVIYSAFGESDTAIQFFQITCDALAAVVIFLIVGEILPLSAALLAGMLTAFSPQFAWNSVLLLPDSLAVLPLLLAVYCLARATKKPRLVHFIVAGALVGISCWLRANALLLPFFIAAAALLLFARQRPWRYALAVIAGTILVAAPLTIRNAIVFRHFIPLSLGAGQTLLEGIADYDPEGKFGIPKTDLGIMKLEAEESHRPDYNRALFNPDGIERERWRLARGFAVIRSHPFWFAGVMTRRAASMLRLERSRLVSTSPPVSHAMNFTDAIAPVWTNTPAELLATGVVAASPTRVSPASDGQTLTLTGDDSKYSQQFASPAVSTKRNTDYVITIPIKIDEGRIRISVTGLSGKVYASTIIETPEIPPSEPQQVQPTQLPFVAEGEQVRIVLSNEASNPANPVVQIGAAKLFELGPARFLWTRYPRLLVHGAQKLFLTAIILPLVIIGLLMLIAWQRWQTLMILMVVPVYYFCVQSIVHTEYRYVLTVDYFLFVLVGVAITSISNLVIKKIPALRSVFARSNH